MKLLATSSALAAMFLSRALAAPAPVPAPAPDAAPEPIPAPVAVEPHLEERIATVTVDIPTGGKVKGRSLLNVESFNAIPFADPPVGQLRLRPPKRLSTNPGTIDGTGLAPGCPQMFVSSGARDALSTILGTLLDIPFLKPITGQEDCLTVNVQRPAGTKATDKLPVLFWIYGGGFELGSTNTYDATSLLASAVGQKQPFVFVAVNYRVAGFGFMPGKEILKDGSANLGLLDQRMGLEWVADNIAAFGGDPTKVTIWGESAGAISVFDQMLLYGGNATYKGQPLFRGAIMNSGSAVPADPVDCPKGQAVYDAVVKEGGCAGASDTLKCLRDLDYETFLNAANSVPGLLSYNSVALSYLPRPDGVVLPDSPDKLGEQGRFYAVPSIIGDQEDEGTIFSIFQSNVTSVDDMTNYLSQLFFHNAPKSKLKELVNIYEPALLQGSPFRTGIFNELYPGFKRMAAILGDLTFTLTRRVVLKIATKTKPDMPIWSYLSSYDYGTPVVGTFHASDILQVFYGVLPNNAMRSCRTYYFNFLYNLDPNKGVGGFARWPQWKEKQELMWFKSAVANGILKDDFRSGAAAFIEANKGILHI
ncbi:cholinesterase [Purpureocillium lilacinum]|uniref:Carboxylic ester hydrolase n=1 Tax=Purpureocillium lilacinum TaxID=33203 RepID=A0A179GPE0_PURLI|nr:cholinesterase [Purpureocillium lilacinum]OAQ79787.1 cholinesterase [Purpureocillium lilacinum]OAQ88810.1 cholinesterase [Purpureocillium lilacinum]PWI73617.1 Lipase 5 [Purpureocillium lilacinum]GJN84588.1 hypothetical protein PLIIFM63780_008149 [Purpureocillium lilacinum]